MRCYCGIFSAELPWKVSTGARELRKALPSVRAGVSRRPGAVRVWARAPGVVRAYWPGAGRRCGGAGGNLPVCYLINDAHAAPRGSCALSLALGLVENGQGNGWHRARQAHHPAGACAPTQPTLASPGGREAGHPQTPSRGHLPGVAGQGTRVCSPSSCGATCHTRIASSWGGDRTQPGLQRGAGRRPPQQCQPRGRAESGRAEGQATEAGR